MKINFLINFLITIASLATTHFALAQEPAPRVALSIRAVNSYRFHSGSSRVADYYALGSKANLVFNDTWLLGFTQLTSVAPGNLLPGAGLGAGNTRISEYALTGGRKWHFTPRAYALGSIQGASAAYPGAVDYLKIGQQTGMGRSLPWGLRQAWATA